jgi:hypothetical protein
MQWERLAKTFNQQRHLATARKEKLSGTNGTADWYQRIYRGGRQLGDDSD